MNEVVDIQLSIKTAVSATAAKKCVPNATRPPHPQTKRKKEEKKKKISASMFSVAPVRPKRVRGRLLFPFPFPLSPLPFTPNPCPGTTTR